MDLGVRDVLGGREARFERGRGLAMSLGGRARAGQEVHAAVEAERDPTWSSERTVRVSVVVRGWTCTLHGRMDGVEEADDYTLIEEVKSTALDGPDLAVSGGFPEWEAQVRLYVWMAGELRWPRPTGLLRVVSLQDGAQRTWTVDASGSPALGAAIAQVLEAWVFERETWLAWQGVRRDGRVAPAHPEWREGQDAIEAASRAAVDGGRHLLLTAPTGVGKTAAVLAGVLRGAARRGLGVYWATSKGTQRWIVEKTVQAMIAGGTPVRAVTLRSRESACCNRVGQDLRVECTPEACRFAAGHVANTKAFGVVASLQPGLADAERVDGAAASFTVCPYELAVELGAVADLVIGDYNQAFEPSRPLRRMFDERDWVIVVDEAHQLPDRAMGYGSPALPLALTAPVLGFVDRRWDAMKELAVELHRRIEESSWQAVERLGSVDVPGAGPDAGGDMIVELTKGDWADLRDRVDELAVDHARLRGLVDPAEHLAWEELAFAVIRFADALQRAGEETLVLWSASGLRLLCRDPAPVLKPSFERCVASVSMSATLAPTWFYRERCGMDAARVDELTIASPFPPGNRRVTVVNGVSTAFKDREKQRSMLRQVLEGILAEPAVADFPAGNVAFYFASYEQRDDLCAGLEVGRRRVLLPARPTPGVSDEEARAHVVAELQARRDVLLATVLGGAFSEGVDLPNDALSTVVIVGPALPPPSVDRRLVQAWYEDRWAAGFDLAYVQPGMTKVVQAAGRVVRSATDRGSVWLVCERFLRHEFAALLPADWVIARRAASRVAALAD